MFPLPHTHTAGFFVHESCQNYPAKLKKSIMIWPGYDLPSSSSFSLIATLLIFPRSLSEITEDQRPEGGSNLGAPAGTILSLIDEAPANGNGCPRLSS
jgi:hypothetical protein